MLVEFGEYQDNSGYWHVGYFKSFTAGRDNFVLPARAMGLSLDKYYKFVIDEFKPDIIVPCENGLVIFKWKNYGNSHKLMLLLNRNARKNNLTI